MTINPFTSADGTAVHVLMTSSRKSHIHLDWRTLSDQLAGTGMLAWLARNSAERNRPVAFLGATPANGGAAWLRFAALAEGIPPESLNALWFHLRRSLHEAGIAPVAVLALTGWIEGVVRAWDFRQTNAVVTLRHRGATEPLPTFAALRVRDATHDDLPAVAAVDAAAFESLWRHNQSDLRYARAAAACFMLAELEGQVVGYQLSTQHGISGHLARLAVDPRAQNRGVGRSLVASALDFFHARGVREVTVNTQRDNRASQHLYRRMGFKFTRQSVPIWTFDPANV